jgi:hypothetical protein
VADKERPPLSQADEAMAELRDLVLEAREKEADASSGG